MFLKYLGELQLNIYHNYNFIALKKANWFTVKTTFTNHERHLVQIQGGYQPNANDIMCLCKSHTAAWIASNHFTRKLICIYTMCLIHQSYQVQCMTKTLKQQSDKHSIVSTTAHTHTASFKGVIEEISPWCKHTAKCRFDESIQMCPNAHVYIRRGCLHRLKGTARKYCKWISQGEKNK